MDPSFSPDGTIRIDWDEYDGRMSHVINSPQIVWVATGKTILAASSDWDGSVKWLENGNAFLLHLRGYSGGGMLSVMIDPANDLFRIGGEQGQSESLANLRRRLDDEMERPTAQARESSKQRETASRFFSWVFLILLLVGLALWIAELVKGKPLRKQPPKTLIREIPMPTR